MKTYGDIENKFRFVILASRRAKQLLKGSKPKIKSKSKNLIRIAQDEVKKGMVDYEITQPKREELHEPEDEVFIGEAIGEGEEESGEQDVDVVESEKDEKTEDKVKKDVKAKSKEKKKKKKKKK